MAPRNPDPSCQSLSTSDATQESDLPMTQELLFTKEEWDAAMPVVVEAMTNHVRAYRAPVFEDFGDHSDGWGSGSYLQFGERVFILTNEHVARARQAGRRLIHQFAGQDDFRLIVGDHAEHDWPLDLALLPVDRQAWRDASNQSRAISLDQISLAHRPAPGEIFTFTGFSGQETKFYFNTMIYTGTCSTAREVELPEDDRFDSRFHLGLDYRPDLAKTVIGDKGLPLPPGLSGSTLWNTRFVEAKIVKKPWTPTLAVVTGVIWGWPSAVGCLVATRAEYLRSFLLGALEFAKEPKP
jgi:hypothetical protein